MTFTLDFVDICFMRDIVHALAYQKLQRQLHPVVTFEERDTGILESCIAPAQQIYLYDDDPYLATANIIYRLIKNHPFHNGNKRIAMVAMITIISENIALNLSESPPLDAARIIEDLDFQQQMDDLALLVAASAPGEKEAMVTLLRSIIKHTFE